MAIRFLKSKILVIIGSTSTGKTDLALYLAKKFNGELVACDSRQVYKGLDIGTGKTPGGECKVQSAKLKVKKGKGYWWLDGVKIWMYDVADANKQYTVYHYVKDAKRVVEDIVKRGKLPIVVGGTGLYLKALLEGLPSLAIPVNLKLRKKLEKRSLLQLQKMLQRISPKRWARMNSSDRQNPRRLIRSTEIIQNSKLKTQNLKLQLKVQNYNILKIGLTAPREVLYKKINDKVLEWIEEGIVDEVKRLIKEGVTKKRIKNLGLEYAVVIEYFDKKISLDQMIDKMQNKVRQYAKRQITWFKNLSTHSTAAQAFGSEAQVFDSEVAQTRGARRGRTEQSRSTTGSGCTYWFDITQGGWLDQVENKINSWYYFEG